MNIQLEDLVYTYPDINDIDIQTKISAKQEFREISGLSREPPPKRGELFRHQKVFNRIMRQYDNQLVIHETGSGKGCSTISLVEHYKSIADALEALRGESKMDIPYKRAYVLVRGQTLIDEFKFQIVCKCTDGSYITEQIINSKTDKQRKGNISRSVNKFYSILTYGTFAKQLLELTDSQILEEMNHCIFIVDEVHNITGDFSGGTLKEDPITGNKFYVHMSDGEEKIMESRLIYDQLWRLFHLVFPRKVMLLSATPMINDASELGPRLNLILPRDRQIPSNTDFNKISIDELEPYIRGLISYVRSLDTGAIVEYIGEPLNILYDRETGNTLEEDLSEGSVKAQMIVYKTYMGEIQNSVYRLAEENPQALRPQSDKPEAFDDLKRQVANFIFPDNTTGSQGYNKYVGENLKIDKKFSAQLKTHLKELSCKYAEIIRLCKEEGGNCWCYSHYITGSGANILALSFQAHGFSRFEESTSIFLEDGAGNLPSLCGGKTLTKNRTIRIQKALRYALLTSNTSGPEAQAMLEAFNSYENRHGEYIKVMIGSPMTRDGINLANVLQIHLTGPGWNQASTYQAESRAIRSTSHVDLIEEERERLSAEGKNPDSATVTIKVYRHAAVDSNNSSIDINMYKISEFKDRQIRRIMRMMKQIAIDCQINYARNVRDNDIDNSAICDYDICAYKCYGKIPTTIDTSSYDVLYSKELVEIIKEEIINIFRWIFRINISQLYREIQIILGIDDFANKFIDLALTELVSNKTPIYNRYGYISYLREDRGIFFLNNEFPLTIHSERGSVAISEYTNNLLGLSLSDLEDYIGVLQIGNGDDILENFNNLTPEGVKDKLSSLILSNQIKIVEESIIRKYVNILEHYKNNIFEDFVPQESIALVREAIGKRGTGRGRKPSADSKFKPNQELENNIGESLKNKSKEIVYFHNLSTLEKSTTSHNIAAKSIKSEGKIRIFMPNENIGWRDADPAEEIIYNKIILNKMNTSNNVDIYGTILGDGKFRIIDKTVEEKAEKGEKVDRRKIKRGRECKTWKKEELLKLLWKLNFRPSEISVNLNRKELIDFLISEELAERDEANMFSDEQLKFYYRWTSSGINIIKICELLKTHLEGKNLLKIV